MCKIDGWSDTVLQIFSSFHDLIVAWFNNSWIGAEAVIVQIPTQGLKEVVTRSYIERKFDLPVNC